MFDSSSRNIHYLRLSVTDLCNLRCRYCMPDGVEKLEREAVLTYEEFLRLAALFAQCGIDTVRVTGGEPLVRKDVDQLVAGLKAIPGSHKVTLTTNGILLARQLPALLSAGLDSVNISLDTLRPEVFQRITARDEFSHVIEGLRAALDSGIPVKLNCVPQAGVNEGELEDLAALAEAHPLQVRFIEMMPIGLGNEFTARDEETVKGLLERAYGPMTPTKETLGNGPCHYYTLENFQGRIGFISALSHKFCSQCNRVRLTSTGYLKGCLQFENGADLKALLRGGVSDALLKETIQKTIYEKPAGHNFQEKKNGTEESHIMAQIGG